MATTTPNFGWPVPTSTDLVKDGATAIEALGDGIDASLLDLKGGTTGQVLAKTSATDLDFTWVTTDDTNAIQNAIVDAKGDLIAASANDTPARLAVGNNGETLVADSSTSTGLRYQVGNGLAQGLINGGFDVWQRATSSTTQFGFTTADRWTTYSGDSVTWSRESSVVPAGSQYSFKCLAGATFQPVIEQAIETSNAVGFAGKTVVLSAQLSASTATNVILALSYSTSVDVGVGGSWTAITATGSAQGAAGTGGAFNRINVIYSIPSTAKSLLVRVYTGSTITSGTALYIGQAMLEIGSVGTEFRRAGGTIQGELAACQRYLPAYFYKATNRGWSYNTTNTQIYYDFNVTPRVAPTGITYSNLSDFRLYNKTAASYGNPTAIAYGNASTSSGQILITITAGSPTIAQGEPAELYTAGGSGYILWTGCEL